jgi:hypothetical protein
VKSKHVGYHDDVISVQTELLAITENTAVGIRHADHVAPSIRKSWH